MNASKTAWFAKSMMAVLVAATLANCGRPQVKGDAGSGAGGVDSGTGGSMSQGGGAISTGGGMEPDGGTLEPVELKIEKILPPRSVKSGATTATLIGQGFLRNVAGSVTAAKKKTTFKIGANNVIEYSIIDDGTLEFRVPPGQLGASNVTLQNPNGSVVCTGCFTYYDALFVSQMSPTGAPLRGGTTVRLTGQGFTNDVVVLFGSRSSPLVTLVSATALDVVVPPGAALGVTDVNVFNKNGSISLRGQFQYVANVEITAVTPSSAPTQSTSALTLTGNGFDIASEVRLGATLASIQSKTAFTINIATPLISTSGPSDVTVVTPYESVTKKNALYFYDALSTFSVSHLSPNAANSGEHVTLFGNNLNSGTLSVTIGGANATVSNASFSQATVQIPAQAVGLRTAPVVVTHNGTPTTLAKPFTYHMALGSVAPGSGPQAGGTSVVVSGNNLPQNATVKVGALSSQVANNSSLTNLTFITPRGAGGGMSDVVIQDNDEPDNLSRLSNVFVYIEALSIGGIAPLRGAIAGGTLINVTGTGFADGMVVKFGDGFARDIKIIDSHNLTCRTPKSNTGVVDVTVLNTQENDVLKGAFSYFDPRNSSGGLSGGPLVGTLNITVLDATPQLYGQPIPLANVMLGTDKATPYQGLTDNRGQLTFSDAPLVKAQTVTVFKENFETTTVTAVNAENLTVLIHRTGGDGEPSPPQPQPPVKAAFISGKVTGFKAPRPLQSFETLEARVFVAQNSVFNGPPFAGVPTRRGETWKISKEGGAYNVMTLPGTHAVYAIGGILNNQTLQFEPVLMGIRRGIATSADVPAADVTIILDTYLNVTVPISIDSPVTIPTIVGIPPPALNSVYAWLDLGSEGLVPNPNNWATGTSAATITSSTQAQLSFKNFPPLDGSNFIFLNFAEAGAGPTGSYYFRRQPGDVTQGVTIGPMLPMPLIVEPTANTLTNRIRWTVSLGGTPDLNSVSIIKPSPFGNVTLWSVVLPGSETQVDLPQAAIDKLKQEEQGTTLYAAMISSRSPRFDYSTWSYELLGPISWSAFTVSNAVSFVP